MQTRRAFIDRHAPIWAARAAERRAMGTPADLRIADVLDRVVAEMRAELATLPADPPAGDAGPITWKSPVFWPGGRFNPWAGSYREAMLASAATCEQLGEHGFARSYRERAAALGDEDGTPRDDQAVPAPPRPGPRAVWTGPNLPPPEPAPFVAGPQLGLL